jgi:hypothetical protein
LSPEWRGTGEACFPIRPPPAIIYPMPGLSGTGG